MSETYNGTNLKTQYIMNKYIKIILVVIFLYMFVYQFLFRLIFQ